jgi:hypothetical protein
MAKINLYTALAIQRLRPGVGFVLDGVDHKNIIWNAENVVPLSDAEVEAMVLVIKAEEEAKIDAKQSALNKLMALGLTEEEALALGK